MTWRKEFNELEPGYKLSLIASWFLAASLCLFVVTSALVVANWYLKKEVPLHTKKAFVLGFGGSIGLLVFGCGATMLGDRQLQAELNRPNSVISNQPNIDHYRCKTCKYYSWSSALPCTVNPSIALTKDAEHCADWEEA